MSFRHSMEVVGTLSVSENRCWREMIFIECKLLSQYSPLSPFIWTIYGFIFLEEMERNIIYYRTAALIVSLNVWLGVVVCINQVSITHHTAHTHNHSPTKERECERQSKYLNAALFDFNIYFLCRSLVFALWVLSRKSKWCAQTNSNPTFDKIRCSQNKRQTVCQ